MQSYREDKENWGMSSTVSENVKLQGSFFPLKKVGNSMNNDCKDAKSSRGRFGKLLTDVTNEIIVENDEKYAQSTQVDEAYDIANEWVREEKDRRIAEKVAQELEEAEKFAKQMLVAKGESAALTFAMEERRRVLAEEKSRRELEAKDVEACKKLIIDEIDEECNFKAICAKDDAYAKEVYEQIQDELLAETLHQQEVAEAKRKAAEQEQLLKADEKIAKEHYEVLSKEWELSSAKQSDADFELAKAHQAAFDAQTKLKNLKQEAEDYLISRKLAVNVAREEHRRQKKIAWMKSDAYSPFSDPETIGKQWENADAEAEDVEDGICLTIILPQLCQLQVKACKKNRIEIDAERAVHVNDSFATVDNAQYLAEFEIDGGSVVQVTDKDISYEYISETGLLHIYVDRVRLFTSEDSKDIKMQAPRPLMEGVKNTFKRFFGKV